MGKCEFEIQTAIQAGANADAHPVKSEINHQVQSKKGRKWLIKTKKDEDENKKVKMDMANMHVRVRLNMSRNNYKYYY